MVCRRRVASAEGAGVCGGSSAARAGETVARVAAAVVRRAVVANWRRVNGGLFDSGMDRVLDALEFRGLKVPRGWEAWERVFAVVAPEREVGEMTQRHSGRGGTEK